MSLHHGRDLERLERKVIDAAGALERERVLLALWVLRPSGNGPENEAKARALDEAILIIHQGKHVRAAETGMRPALDPMTDDEKQAVFRRLWR